MDVTFFPLKNREEKLEGSVSEMEDGRDRTLATIRRQGIRVYLLALGVLLAGIGRLVPFVVAAAHDAADCFKCDLHNIHSARFEC